MADARAEELCKAALDVAEHLLEEVVSADDPDDDGIGLASGLAQMVAMSSHESDRAASIQQHCKVAEGMQELKSSMSRISGDCEDKINALKECSSAYTAMISHRSALPSSSPHCPWTAEVDSLKAKIGEIAEGVMKQKLEEICKKADAIGGGAGDKACWKSSLSQQPKWEEIETAATNLISAGFAKLLDTTVKNGNTD